MNKKKGSGIMNKKKGSGIMNKKKALAWKVEKNQSQRNASAL